MISRFDLIYIVLDEIDEDKDKKMADHILELFEEIELDDNIETDTSDSNVVNSDFMKN